MRLDTNGERFCPRLQRRSEPKGRSLESSAKVCPENNLSSPNALSDRLKEACATAEIRVGTRGRTGLLDNSRSRLLGMILTIFKSSRRKSVEASVQRFITQERPKISRSLGRGPRLSVSRAWPDS